jgi:hypothetical protein
MSMKASLTYFVDKGSGTSAHLYEECLASTDLPVFLAISGVSVASTDVTRQGTDVTVARPRALAAKLGLVPPLKNQE